MSGNGSPIVPMRFFAWSRIGLQCVTGEASVSPYPSTRFPPVSSLNFVAVWSMSGADPEMHATIERRSYFGANGELMIAL